MYGCSFIKNMAVILLKGQEISTGLEFGYSVGKTKVIKHMFLHYTSFTHLDVVLRAGYECTHIAFPHQVWKTFIVCEN